MNTDERDAYRYRWADWPRRTAITIAKRVMQSNLRRGLAEEQHRKATRAVEVREGDLGSARHQVETLKAELESERGA